ncbi:MAG: hypothetical protein HZY79_15535 [Rhodoblastus sp.]|nr:MAG: hypothetical protein HZY79_15535 [Rhodoblastus sp.]
MLQISERKDAIIDLRAGDRGEAALACAGDGDLLDPLVSDDIEAVRRRAVAGREHARQPADRRREAQ